MPRNSALIEEKFLEADANWYAIAPELESEDPDWRLVESELEIMIGTLQTLLAEVRKGSEEAA